MAEEAGGIDGNEALVNGADTMPQIGLISQYVKDLSFENPNSPAVYQWQGQPQIDVQFNIGSNQFADDIFEVLLKRSEEHTSELQSLMRISYAVFCLKKKI